MPRFGRFDLSPQYWTQLLRCEPELSILDANALLVAMYAHESSGCAQGAMQALNLQAYGSVLPCLANSRPSHRAPHLRRQPGLQVFAVAEVAENRAAAQNGLSFQVNDNFPPAEPEPVSPEVQAIIDEQGLDYEASGLKYLTNEARVSYAQRFLQVVT